MKVRSPSLVALFPNLILQVFMGISFKNCVYADDNLMSCNSRTVCRAARTSSSRRKERSLKKNHGALAGP